MGKNEDVQEMQTVDFDVRIKSSEFIENLETKQEKINLTADQQNLLTMLGNHVDKQCAYRHRDGVKPPQLKVLVLGGPGVGKSFVIERFTEMLENAGLKSIVTAYTGVAVSLHKNAETISSKFHLKILKKDEKKNTPLMPLDPIKDAALIQKLKNDFRDIDYLIIEESSMVDGITFGNMGDRTSEILAKLSEEFGGVNVILVGDFWQLPPVSGMSLYRDVLIQYGVVPAKTKIEEYPIGPRFKGIVIFSKFQKFELNEYVRSSKD